MITPNIIERSWIQGATVAVEYLTGTAFSGENGAHTFRITGKDADGQPVAVSGTVLAKILRADNITVDVSGSVVDGVAEVTLVGDCYNVPGRTSLVIFLSDGTNTVTLYAAIFNVFRSTSGVEIDSGVSIPTLTELLAQIERMETATAAAEAATNRAEHLLETSEQTAWNQLNANTGATSTASGVTFTNNGDGTWTLTGNATATERKLISSVSMVVGHVYAVLNGGIDTTGMNAYVCLTTSGSNLKAFNTEQLYTAEHAYNQFSLRAVYGFTAPEGGLKFAPMLIDLTAIYGEGLEPTLAEFRQQYPHRIYPYAAIGSTRNLDITEVHGAQIAELQDDLAEANTAISANATAITALDNAKADKVDLAHTNRVLSALVEAGKGKILRFETDANPAYAKTVPSGALNATVTEWGGKSVVWNQLNNVSSSQTVTHDTTGNPSWGQFNGIANHKYFVFVKQDVAIEESAYKAIRIDHRSGEGTTETTYFVQDGTAGVKRCIYQPNDNQLIILRYRVVEPSADVTYSNYRCVDLTQLGYGDITSVSDPRIASIEAYAIAHPEFSDGTIVNADVVSIDTVGVNLFDGTDVTNTASEIRPFYNNGIRLSAGTYSIAYYEGGEPYAVNGLYAHEFGGEEITHKYNASSMTVVLSEEKVVYFYAYGTGATALNADYTKRQFALVKGSTAPTTYAPYHSEQHPIPSAVLAAYPLRSAGSLYDTISFDGEKWWHEKNVAPYTFDGTESWSALGTNNAFFTMKLTDAKYAPNVSIVADKFVGEVSGVGGAHSENKAIWLQNTDAYKRLYVVAEGETVYTVKTFVEGTTVIYPLATPVITDITDIMGTAGTDLIAMAVESGGTLTFAQANGTIFPVPNSVTYTVKISEVE